MKALAALALALASTLSACAGASRELEPDRDDRQVARIAPDPAPPEPIVISIVGTNDLHGHVARLPLLGGYLRNLRAVRESGGGGVLLVDAGDMFQGTVESNMHEGRAVIEAYDVLGYAAAAIGNHEFDYGPVGPLVTPREEGDDPRGALKARAAQASFPLLLGNVIEAESGQPPSWGHVSPTAIVEIARVPIGIVGMTTIETPTTTIAANVQDLRMVPLAQAAVEHARAVREAGARVVVLVVHAGGKCQRFDDPADVSSCDPDQEVFELARALPPDLVDVIVAGHTHSGVAHRVNGIPIVESYAYGSAFGRVDLVLSPDGDVVEARVHPPERLCDSAAEACEYEGAPVVPDERVAAVIADDLEEAARIRARASGVTVEARIPRDGRREGPLGNLIADLILTTRPRANVAIINGGGVRADFPAGELTYGAFYETFPFDNRFAIVRTTKAALEALYESVIAGDASFMFLAGARVRAECRDGELDVSRLREDGRPWPARRPVIIALSDFLATGGDSVAFTSAGADITIEDGAPMRDQIFEMLAARGGTIRASDHYDPERRRVIYEGERPVRCEIADRQ